MKTARDALRAIVLRNMALSDGSRRRLLVSSSQRRLNIYNHDHRDKEFIFCDRIDKARGIDRNTPVVMLNPTNHELREFIEKRFTSTILYDMM